MLRSSEESATEAAYHIISSPIMPSLKPFIRINFQIP